MKISLNNRKKDFLTAPFILTKEYGMNAELILHPKFRKEMESQFVDYDDQIFDLTTQGTTSSFIFKNQAPTDQQIFEFKLDQEKQVVSINYREKDNNYIFITEDQYKLGENGILIKTHNYLSLDSDVKVISRIHREKYDPYGILDEEKCLDIRIDFPENILIQMINQDWINTIMKNANQYIESDCLTKKPELLLPGSYDLKRHPEFIEKGLLTEIVTKNGQKELVENQSVPFYNLATNDSYIFSMGIHNIEKWRNPTKNFTEQQRKSLGKNEQYQTLDYEQLDDKTLKRAIMQENVSPFTREAMKTRVEKRLALTLPIE